MSDTTFDTTPLWYGGSEGILKNSLERGRDLYRSPYQKYQGERISPFNPTQRRGFEMAEGEANNPFYSDTFGQAGEAIRNALGQNITPYLERATGATDIGEFYNPYEKKILQNLQQEGNRNLQENLLPNINTKFIGAGQYGSTGHQDLTNRAIRDTQEGISKASGAAQHAGFNTALQAALQKQESNLNAGQLAGKDIERQMLGGEALQNLAGSQQNSELKRISLLDQVGKQQQQQTQNEQNVQYQNFQDEANFPYLQQARETEMIRGQPVSTQHIYSAVNPNPPQQPQASPYTQAGGMMMGLTGAMNQRPQGFSKGGMVKKLTKHRHYAEGGSLSPIQQGANHAIETAELKSMRDQATKLSTPNVDPFWASIARAGFNVASNRHPGVLAKLGEAGNAGMNEYQSQLGNQDNRGLQSAKIMNLIDNTRRLQAENNRKHQFETEKFAEDNKQFGMTHGIHKGTLGLAREKFEHERGLYDQGLKGLKGSQGKAADDLFKKSNQAALEEARKSISTLPTLKSNLSNLKALAEKLDTGPTLGKIARSSSTLGSLAGVGSAQDIDAFDSLTNSLVLDLGNQLKGSQVALGKLKIIEQSKPQLTKVKGGNIEIINHMQDLTKLAEEKARFINKSLKNNINAIDAEDAFNQYADAKLEYEEKGEKFPNTPDDFLEGAEYKDPENSSSVDLSSMSDEELEKIAGKQ